MLMNCLFNVYNFIIQKGTKVIATKPYGKMWLKGTDCVSLDTLLERKLILLIACYQC